MAYIKRNKNGTSKWEKIEQNRSGIDMWTVPIGSETFLITSEPWTYPRRRAPSHQLDQSEDLSRGRSSVPLNLHIGDPSNNVSVSVFQPGGELAWQLKWRPLTIPTRGIFDVINIFSISSNDYRGICSIFVWFCSFFALE